MPRLNSRTPAYTLHKRSGHARVFIDGREISLGKFGSPESRAEYDRIIAEWLANGRRMDATTPDRCPESLTVSEMILAYWRFGEGYYRKNGKLTSEVHNIKLALRPLLERYGHTEARDFGPLALKTIRRGWIESGILCREINKRAGRVIRAFKWAVENEMVPQSVHQALKALAGLRMGRSEAPEGKAVRPVPDDQVDAVRPFVARQVWAMVELQRLTGMRSG